jgi:type I restriction enzyme M protein
MKCYGQEINPLSAAIGKMNLFLNGVLNFKIVNADTLKYPAFTEAGQLQQFDIVLANPPYSISSWNRDAFETDQYGRNFLGVPPQGRADYAFFQHILKSLKPGTGRCAILFPHGVLFRGEEKDMREKLVQHDLVECVIGIGKNLFYNSPMEACIVICNTNKPVARRGKVLFINAKNEVTRKNSQSYLEEEHITKIAGAYTDYATIDGFSAVATIDEIAANESKLSIALYVRKTGGGEEINIDDAIDAWKTSAATVRMEYEKLNQLIKAGENDDAL